MIRPVTQHADIIVSPRARTRKVARRLFRVVEIKRLVGAVRASGMNVESLEMRPDGTIRLFTGKPLQETNDDLFSQWEAPL